MRNTTKSLDDGYHPVTNPPHYTKGRTHETLFVIEDWDLDYHLGNVVKYISRAGRKGSVLEDLGKAKFYLDRRIEIERAKTNGKS